MLLSISRHYHQHRLLSCSGSRRTKASARTCSVRSARACRKRRHWVSWVYIEGNPHNPRKDQGSFQARSHRAERRRNQRPADGLQRYLLYPCISIYPGVSDEDDRKQVYFEATTDQSSEVEEEMRRQLWPSCQKLSDIYIRLRVDITLHPPYRIVCMRWRNEVQDALFFALLFALRFLA